MRPSSTSFRGQRGAVLFIAIIVVVVMTLAGIALVRSIDTSNLIAGNLAFHESATHSGDTGVEAAIAWLQLHSTDNILNADNPAGPGNPLGGGYAANGIQATQSPAAGQTWDAYWNATAAARAKRYKNPPATDANDFNRAGNQVDYIIDRMCAFTGPPTGGANCLSSPLYRPVTGNEERAGRVGLNTQPLVLYRITAKITGPRNTVSYVQATVAL